MRYLLCPDKFKGSLTAGEVCEALRKGIVSVEPDAEVVMIPMADGGDGSIDLLVEELGLDKVDVQTVDPLGKEIQTAFYRSGEVAYVELAGASGLVLLTESARDPLKTSTYGTGLVIRHAINSGCREINLFIGGSATNDAAMGIAKALGFHFLDSAGNELDGVGISLGAVERVNYDSANGFRDKAKFKVVCDVDNPFFGPRGAAHVYAEQKGADERSIELLDSGLRHFAGRLVENGYKNIGNVSGAGAAGGVGGGMMALFDTELVSGVNMFFDMFDLEEAISTADIIITGEGKFDDQSFQGKVVGRICAASEHHMRPCIVVCGLDAHTGASDNIKLPEAVYPIMDEADSVEDAMNEAYKYLVVIGSQIAIDAAGRAT